MVDMCDDRDILLMRPCPSFLATLIRLIVGATSR